MLDRLHVKSEASTLDGGWVHVVTPGTMPDANRDKVLIHVHGGCYVLFPGESGTMKAVMMAGLGHYRVIAMFALMQNQAAKQITKAAHAGSRPSQRSGRLV